jgi:hypothetical protein
LQGVPFFNESSGRPFLTAYQITAKATEKLNLPRKRPYSSALPLALSDVAKAHENNIERVTLCLDGLNVTHDDGVNLIMNATLYRWVD